MSDENKLIIYQVFTRLFGNNNNHCINNGSITENGCGKMADFTAKALGERYQPDVLRYVPLECLLAETDESTQDIRMVIGRMAETKNVEVSFLCDRIDENARKIFFRQ